MTMSELVVPSAGVGESVALSSAGGMGGKTGAGDADPLAMAEHGGSYNQTLTIEVTLTCLGGEGLLSGGRVSDVHQRTVRARALL